MTFCSVGVLDENDDVLLNVNIVDDEKAAKNVELKKGKPGYNPYDEEEVDEFGNVSSKLPTGYLLQLLMREVTCVTYCS